jgi:hypothetical protein
MTISSPSRKAQEPAAPPCLQNRPQTCLEANLRPYPFLFLITRKMARMFTHFPLNPRPLLKGRMDAVP